MYFVIKRRKESFIYLYITNIRIYSVDLGCYLVSFRLKTFVSIFFYSGQLATNSLFLLSEYILILLLLLRDGLPGNRIFGFCTLNMLFQFLWLPQFLERIQLSVLILFSPLRNFPGVKINFLFLTFRCFNYIISTTNFLVFILLRYY